MKKVTHITDHPRNYSAVRKRLLKLIEKADDRQVLKLYAFAHRMMDDKVK